MSIVKNKQAILEFANTLANHLIKEIGKKVTNFYGENDPAEHIYLVCQTMGSLNAKICFAMEGYGKIYGIENLTASIINQTIDSIKNVLIDFNKEQITMGSKGKTMQ